MRSYERKKIRKCERLNLGQRLRGFGYCRGNLGEAVDGSWLRSGPSRLVERKYGGGECSLNIPACCATGTPPLPLGSCLFSKQAANYFR